MNDIVVRDRILGGLWGAVVSDALGVPVEFAARANRKQDPVVDMREYGTFHQPKGTWSDDSSLMLCTVESLLNGFDTDGMADLFVRWLSDAYWTPWGKVFDAGGATVAAIGRMIEGVPPEEAGGISERDNGNGSLMRILPIGLYFTQSPAPELFDYAQIASSLTHRHPRSRMACGIYCLMISYLLTGMHHELAYWEAVKEASQYYDKEPYKSEFPYFDRLFSGMIRDLPEEKIQSDGYVIHTLEAAIWCLLTTETFKEAVLKAVNLGEDTDTTAIVTGGLAGVYYGLSAIPPEWIEVIARKEDIEVLFQKFLGTLHLH